MEKGTYGLTGVIIMIKEPHIIGTYQLLLKQKDNITWGDIVNHSQEHLPEDSIPYDAGIYHAAKELAFALEKIDSHRNKISLK